MTRPSGVWLTLPAVLWAQLYAACVYSWRFGEYYDYGWFVPPLVLLLTYRIVRGMPARAAAPAPLKTRWVLGFGALMLAALAVLRTLNWAAPQWRLPIWIHAALVVAVSVWVFHRLGGWSAARRSIPVWVFACSAIPLPTFIEQLFIRRLTDSVIAATVKFLGFIGFEARAVGDRLSLLGEVVQVTDGCSGIRSAQSFLMASLFFGEWFSLRVGRRVILLLGGLLAAWVLNVTRASSLAVIRTRYGEEAFDGWHDGAGLIAFVIGSGILYGLATMLESSPRGGRVRLSRVERSPA
jgi:exosortase